MPEQAAEAVKGASFFGRLSPRQWRLVAVLGLLIVVAIVVVSVVVSRRVGPSSTGEIRSRLVAVVTTAGADAEQSDGRFDMAKLRTTLDKAGKDTGWIIDADPSDDRKQVGIAARQPDGPACLFVWSVVGGAQSAAVHEPTLPCVAAIALIAAR